MIDQKQRSAQFAVARLFAAGCSPEEIAEQTVLTVARVMALLHTEEGKEAVARAEAELDEEVRRKRAEAVRRLGQAAPLAAQTQVSFITDGQSERTRQRAAMDVLDRNSVVGTKKVEERVVGAVDVESIGQLLGVLRELGQGSRLAGYGHVVDESADLKPAPRPPLEAPGAV